MTTPWSVESVTSLHPERVIGTPTLIRELTRVGMRSPPLMEWALRIMANLMRDEDRGAAESAYTAIAGIVRMVPDQMVDA